MAINQIAQGLARGQAFLVTVMLVVPGCCCQLAGPAGCLVGAGALVVCWCSDSRKANVLRVIWCRLYSVIVLGYWSATPVDLCP